MKIAIFGTGYAGLVTGTCLANLGNDVICCDIDEAKIATLKNGEMPFYEPGLKELVERNIYEERLDFTTDAKKAVDFADVIFICVGTPEDENGKADLKYIFAVAKTIGEHMTSYKVIADKSTVPVGTGEKVRKIIAENLKQQCEFDVVSNPEFLREGNAVRDFMVPDRIVIGCESEKSAEIMKRVYKGIERTGKPILMTDVKTAEIIKYAANAFLATKISFVNELSRFTEKVGADIKTVARGMGLDDRIGSRFLQAGAGYGGSCFPKDIMALIQTAREHDVSLSILQSVDRVNDEQKASNIERVKKLVPELSGKKIAVLGLSFKPKTDDIREAPALQLIKQLLDEGAQVVAFDPVAEEKARSVFPTITYTKTPYECIDGADAMVVVTEWDAFRYLSMRRIKELLRSPNVVDLRNIYFPEDMKSHGLNYVGVGRPEVRS